MCWRFDFQNLVSTLTTSVDTDFAGCIQTRRSTSGGCAMLGRHLLKHWSQTQTTVALSNAEAELSGIRKGASISLGLQSIARDLGILFDINICTDATAAVGICKRRGLGKIRHLHCSDLWIQERLRTKDFRLTKIPGVENPADILTKHVTRELLEKHLKTMNIIEDFGRASSAPTIEHTV